MQTTSTTGVEGKVEEKHEDPVQFDKAAHEPQVQFDQALDVQVPKTIEKLMDLSEEIEQPIQL